MAKKYFSLVVKEDGRWSVQFGDYDRECVESERDDYADRGHKASALRILATADSQAAIDLAVGKLNA